MLCSDSLPWLLCIAEQMGKSATKSARPQLRTRRNISDLRTVALKIVDLRLRIHFPVGPQVL